MRLRHAAREETIFSGADAGHAFARCRALLWSYRFYPSSMVSGSFETPTGGPEVGTVMRQRIPIGPLVFRGPVRVLDVRDEPARAGYRYEALPGHVERGTAVFEVRREGCDVRFRIASESAPAHPLARLVPAFARWRQERAVDAAFKRMRAAAEADA